MSVPAGHRVRVAGPGRYRPADSDLSAVRAPRSVRINDLVGENSRALAPLSKGFVREAEAGAPVRAGSTIFRPQWSRPVALPTSAEADGCHWGWQVIRSPVPT